MSYYCCSVIRGPGAGVLGLLAMPKKRLQVPDHTQVWVYEEEDESGEPNLYVHHDIMLPAFPLSLAWIDCSPSDPSTIANLAAVRPCHPLAHALSASRARFGIAP